MEKQITLQNKKVTYTLRKSTRARRMRLAVYCDGSVVVTTPHDLQETTAEKFIKEKTTWLFSKLAFFRQFKGRSIARHSHQDYLNRKEEALAIVQQKVEILAKRYGFRFNRINIKNQRTRWGSCSKKGNLNFNYKVMFLPANAQEYIIAHELCHLKEFNHSKRFWGLVSKIVSNYSKIKSELKKSGLSFY
ncbi:MAG: SprT family zinc-dependent metalloprotease [Minisyncoccia bacterium]|jgi:predicted metal-dependent hydrolase